MSSTNIIIIGITGVGKTTIGKSLAKYLRKKFYDLDKNIEFSCGVDIPTIFAIEGESRFRERETEELRKIITSEKNYVLSVGGGCAMNALNRALMISGNNHVVQLYADLSIITSRVSKSPHKRPMFYVDDIEAKVRQLYADRCENYDKITDLKINTTGLKPYQVINIISDYIDGISRRLSVKN